MLPPLPPPLHALPRPPAARLLGLPPPPPPQVNVAVSGAAGAIGYSLLFKIASGEMLGPDQPVLLSLLDLPDSSDKARRAPTPAAPHAAL